MTDAEKQAAYHAQRREWYRATRGKYPEQAKSKGRPAT